MALFFLILIVFKLMEGMAKKLITEKKDKATQTPDMTIVIGNFDWKEMDVTFKFTENLPKVQTKDVNVNSVVASVKEEENPVDIENAVSLPPPLVEKVAESRVEWCPPFFRAIRNGTNIDASINT